MRIFLKMSCFQPQPSKTGNKWMRYGVARVLVGWSACSPLIICKFLVGASHLITPRVQLRARHQRVTHHVIDADSLAHTDLHTSICTRTTVSNGRFYDRLG